MSRKKYDDHPGKSRFNSSLLYLFGNYFMRLFYRIHYEGADRMNKRGPVLLLVKHQRYDDIPLGLAVVHGRCRNDVWCVMKDSLAEWYFFGFFIKCGGIPINRKNPEKSKKFLMLARHVLYDGNAVVMFPEQTRVPDKMGKGRSPGFRFIAGKPSQPLAVNSLGFCYKKGFIRTHVFIRIGKTAYYDKHQDPDMFLHDRMHEMAELSLLTYPYRRPEGKPEPRVRTASAASAGGKEEKISE